jgi:hypothetical protein
MNERIKELALEAKLGPALLLHHWKNIDALTDSEQEDLEKIEKFAELIVRECMKESMDEIVADEEIAQEKDPLIREYLTGNNQGIVDAVVRFRNHFGVEE